jgi:hypothetical protein
MRPNGVQDRLTPCYSQHSGAVSICKHYCDTAVVAGAVCADAGDSGFVTLLNNMLEQYQ